MSEYELVREYELVCVSMSLRTLVRVGAREYDYEYELAKKEYAYLHIIIHYSFIGHEECWFTITMEEGNMGDLSWCGSFLPRP